MITCIMNSAKLNILLIQNKNKWFLNGDSDIFARIHWKLQVVFSLTSKTQKSDLYLAVKCTVLFLRVLVATLTTN